jgi:hypothetical protein
MRSLYCFADCSRIIGVVLVGYEVWLDESGMDTPYGMTAGLDHPSPVSGSAASFQADQAFWYIRKEICDLVATQLPSQAYLAIGVYAMKLKGIFCQINADHGNCTHGMASSKEIDTSLMPYSV